MLPHGQGAAEGGAAGPVMQKGPPGVVALSVGGARRCPTLPLPVGGSTIGAGGLSFRVRDGTGRFPFAVAAGTLWSLCPPWPGGVGVGVGGWGVDARPAGVVGVGV